MDIVAFQICLQKLDSSLIDGNEKVIPRTGDKMSKSTKALPVRNFGNKAVAQFCWITGHE